MPSRQKRHKVNLRETALFGMLGAVMYISKILMEFLPNVHLIGVFTVAITGVYRKKALYPIYIFVFLTGLLNGFSVWWLPYLYIWTVLWAAAMLLPSNLPKIRQAVLYMAVCAAHGFLYGTLYAPTQALLFGLDFKGTIAWIIAGLPWDAVHGIGNLVCGLLIMPIVSILRRTKDMIDS